MLRHEMIENGLKFTGSRLIIKRLKKSVLMKEV